MIPLSLTDVVMETQQNVHIWEVLSAHTGDMFPLPVPRDRVCCKVYSWVSRLCPAQSAVKIEFPSLISTAIHGFRWCCCVSGVHEVRLLHSKMCKEQASRHSHLS